VSIAGKREIYAGVRDAVELSALKAVGAAGALIATALHEGAGGQGRSGSDLRSLRRDQIFLPSGPNCLR
jgi:hypothetical protein